jgi:hypothetical protein
MLRVASIAPEEGRLLCEGCGYILSGLPAEAQVCPECGKPLAESAPELRQRPAWEEAGRPAARGFLNTTAAVLFRPSRFYRTLATRADGRAARRFARIHVGMASLLFGTTAVLHLMWMFAQLRIGDTWKSWQAWTVALKGGLGCTVAAYATIIILTRLAARLTAWEAAYRGLRLPREVVLRGLHYHAPHYLPVAGMALATVGGYQLLLALGWADATSGPRYLYIICGEVFLGAGYLFETYWAGMRNMMYANA